MDELRDFYDTNAERFHQTRKKHRPEFDLLIKEINALTKDHIRIVEYGCGSGRFFGYLQEHCTKKFTYTGVDLSKNLIAIAKQQYPNGQFTVNDMISDIEQRTQEWTDLIICIASFQHLANRKERLQFLKNCYRILRYEGQVMMLNRSYSRRLIRKHRQAILPSLIKRCISFGHQERNSHFIPRKEKNVTFKRFYHFFTRKELLKLGSLSHFLIKKIDYVNNAWEYTKRTQSQNSLTIFVKNYQ